MTKTTDIPARQARGTADERHSRMRTASDTEDRLDHVICVLAELLYGQEEIRRQLAGHVKSHLTVEEFGDLAGRAPYTIRDWIKQGRINAIRVAGTGPRGRLLIPREEVTKLLGMGAGGAVPAVAARQ